MVIWTSINSQYRLRTTEPNLVNFKINICSYFNDLSFLSREHFKSVQNEDFVGAFTAGETTDDGNTASSSLLGFQVSPGKAFVRGFEIEKIAKLNVFQKDELIKSVPVFSLEEVKKVNFIKSLFLSLNYLVWGDA